MKNNDLDILKMMSIYCNEIAESMNRFGNFDDFKIDKDYQKTICAGILLIGKLEPKISEKIRCQTCGIIDLNEIETLSNTIFHDYDSINLEKVWNVIENNIPKLKEYCEKQISMLEFNDFDFIIKM